MELDEGSDSEVDHCVGEDNGTNDVVDPLISVNALSSLTNF